MKSGYLIWPTRTPTWAVHTYGITADAVRSALARDVMSPKQQAALICIVGQKTRKPEVAGPLQTSLGLSSTMVMNCCTSSSIHIIQSIKTMPNNALRECVDIFFDCTVYLVCLPSPLPGFTDSLVKLLALHQLEW